MSELLQIVCKKKQCNF